MLLLCVKMNQIDTPLCSEKENTPPTSDALLALTSACNHEHLPESD